MIPASANLSSLIVFALVFLGVIAVGIRMLKPPKSKRSFRPRRDYRPDLRIAAKPGENESLASSAEQLRRVIEVEGALFTQRLRSPEAIAALSGFIGSR